VKLKFRIKKIKKSSINKLRQKDLIISIIALLFLFVGVPGYVSLLNSWNQDISNPGEYIPIGQNETGNYTVESIPGSIGSYSIMSYYYDDGGTDSDLYPQTAIIWGDSNNTLVVEGDHDHYDIYFITPWHISDLIQNNTRSFKIKVQLPRAATYYDEINHKESNFRIEYWDDSDGVIHQTYSTSNMYGQIKFDGGSIVNGYCNRSVLDLMVDRATHGDDRVVFTIRLEGNDYLRVGDVVTFSYSYYELSDTEVPENKALQWGGAIGGIVLGLLALGSTTAWNPLDPKHPGWVDLQLKKLFNRRKRK